MHHRWRYSWTNVRDHIPLEQGLRQDHCQRTFAQTCVRDHIPLEQGLRHSTATYERLIVRSETIFH